MGGALAHVDEAPMRTVLRWLAGEAAAIVFYTKDSRRRGKGQTHFDCRGTGMFLDVPERFLRDAINRQFNERRQRRHAVAKPEIGTNAVARAKFRSEYPHSGQQPEIVQLAGPQISRDGANFRDGSFDQLSRFD